VTWRVPRQHSGSSGIAPGKGGDWDPAPFASGPRLRARPLLRPYRSPLLLAALLSVAEVGVDLARPWPLKVAVDNAIGRHRLTGWLQPLAHLGPTTLAAVASGVAIVLVATSGLLGYLSTYLADASAERVGADLRAALMARLVELSLRFHDRNRTGDLVSRMTGDVGRVQDAMVALLATLIPEVLTVAGMLVVMSLLDPLLALSGLAVMPLLAVVATRRRHRVRAAQRVARAEDGRLASQATDVMRNVRAVQAFGRQPEVGRRFGTQNRAATLAALTTVDLEARYAPLADVVLATGTGLVLWLGVVRVTTGELSVGELLVFLSYLASLYGPVRSLSRLATTLARGASSRDRIAEVLFSPDFVPEDHHAVSAPELGRGLVLDSVRFSYVPGIPVLDRISVRIPAGQRVAVVGASGAGKTTLFNLMLRFYDPDGGAIALDGVDLRRCSLSSLRERIALVPQEPWMLDGTIAENIAFGRDGVTHDEVREAARLALVDEFALRLPCGYETEVGEAGALLSGGQRRRIALARAIVRDAALLLLDEPTTGLDAASEASVMTAVRSATGGRTVLIVTHQLGLALDADRVLVLNQGRLVEDGEPLELLGRDGPLAALWSVQRGHGQEPAGQRGDGVSVGHHLTETTGRR